MRHVTTNIPYACTVKQIQGFVKKAIAATDDGTLTFKDDSASVMGDGVLTFAAGTAIGVGVNDVPSSNNTFAAGEVLTITSGKTTPGGKVIVSIEVEQTT